MPLKAQRTVTLWLPLVIAVSECALVAVIGGCASPFFYTRVIHHDETRYVRLDARYGKGQDGTALRFAHPVNSGEAEWLRLLDRLSVKPRKKFVLFVGAQERPSVAFTEMDRQYLAKYLSEAFARARPDEWVVFYLSQLREPGVTEVSSGGFFVEGGWLHLVLSNYRQPVSMPFIQQRIWENPLRPAGEIFYELVPLIDQTAHTERRPDLTQSLFNEVSVLISDQKVISARPLANSAPGTIVQSGKTQERREELADVEDQLRTLRRFFEEGLITEEDYRHKRQTLLERL